MARISLAMTWSTATWALRANHVYQSQLLLHIDMTTSYSMSVNVIVAILSYRYDQFAHITMEYKSKQVKDCVICHLTFKGNGPFRLIWSYRYDIITSMWPFNSYHMLTLWIVIHDWSQYKRFAQFIPIDMIISIWCDHIDMIRQSSCWLSN